MRSKMKNTIIHRNKLSNKKIGKKNGGKYKLTKKTGRNHKLTTKKVIKKKYQLGGVNIVGSAIPNVTSSNGKGSISFGENNLQSVLRMSGALNNNSSSNKKGSISFGENNLQSVLRMSGALNNNNDNNNNLIIEDTLEALERDYVTDKIAQMFKSEDLIKADEKDEKDEKAEKDEEDEEDEPNFQAIKTDVNNGQFPTIIDDFFKTPDNSRFVKIKELMVKMFAEAKPKNPFRYKYKPTSAWKNDIISSPKKLYDWYVGKNPGFLPIRQQTKKDIKKLEEDTEIYLKTDDSNFVTKKKDEVARYRKILFEFRHSDPKRKAEINRDLGFAEDDLFSITKHLRKITEDLLRLVGRAATITDLLTQPDLDKLPRLPRTYPSCVKKLDPEGIEEKKCESISENSNDNSTSKIAGFYTWESKSLEQTLYHVIYVPEYEFLVMGMVKDLLLVQCLKKMPAPPKTQIKPVITEFDNANEVRSKKLTGAVITDEIRDNALTLLKEFELLITGKYLYTEFIKCLKQYLLFFSIGRLMANSHDLRTLINYLESLTNTCFIVLPTFEQINFKKVLNFCAAPVLNLRLPNTRIYAHSREASIAFELYHDLLNHSFRTHQVTKYIPGYTGQYLGKILFLVKSEFNKFKYKYQPSKVKCMFGIISRRIEELSKFYNYDYPQIKRSQMTLEEFRAALQIPELSEEEKYLFAFMLFYLFHEMKNYCLHDLYFNKVSIITVFESLLTRRQGEMLESTRFFYGLLFGEYQPQFIKNIFNKSATLKGDLDNDLRLLLQKCLNN
jgi:hypothetical protein